MDRREIGLTRAVRVFISSTFVDMYEEREELVKRVFPALRELCESRGVGWGEVDLRWGITEEEANNGQALPICLDEIRDCRPYFLAMLGERYGWVPERIDPAQTEREPWLAEHAQKSITELEIIHGVLADPEMAEHAFFYFRDPRYAERDPILQELPIPEEIEQLGQEAADGLAESRRERLRALKDRIRASGLAVRDGYQDPEAFGELVRSDLTAVVDRLFPAGSEPTPLARERALHDSFARSRAAVWIGRQQDLERLDEHVAGAGAPLVVTGESGVGKSALLANWEFRYADRREQAVGLTARPVRSAAVPENASTAQAFLLTHFIAASPTSGDWAAMLRRLISELAGYYEFELEVPVDPAALRATFAQALHRAAVRGRVVLVIDALDQLEDRDGAPDLVWLPASIPGNIRLVVSALPGRALDELTRRVWPTYQIAPLAEAEREQLIVEYLRQYRKTLPAPDVRKILASPRSANPLFLRVLLEELRLFGKHEELTQRLELLLSAPDIPRLYELVLDRWQADYERGRPELVGEAMSLLWAARRGLSEPELLDLLGDGQRPLPHALWSPLHLAAKQTLIDRNGLLGFAHRHAREAVGERYLPDPAAKAAVHRRLASVFDRHPPDIIGPKKIGLGLPRELEERPWQLARAGEWHELASLLSDPRIVATFMATETESDLHRYWMEIEAASPVRMLDAFKPILDAPQTMHPWLLSVVASLLSHAGHIDEALALSGVALEQSEPDTGALLVTGLPRSAALLSSASMMVRDGRHEDAWPVFKEAERIARETNSRRGLASALDGLAVVSMSRGDHDEALALLRETERIWRELHDDDGLQGSLGNQALILQERGDLDAALALHREEERICRGRDDMDGLRISLNNQATIHERRGELARAWEALKETERIAQASGDPQALGRSLRHQLAVLERQLTIVRGDARAVSILLAETEKIAIALGDHRAVAGALLDRATSALEYGDAAEAVGFASRARELAREQGIADAQSRASMILAMAQARLR